MIQDHKSQHTTFNKAANLVDRLKGLNKARVDETTQTSPDKDEIAIMDEQDLKDVSKFEPLYLIGKILGKTMLLKPLSPSALLTDKSRGSKYIGYGNRFSLIKFSNAVDCNKVFVGQPCFVGD